MSESLPPLSPQIDYEDFLKLDIRAGIVVKAEVNSSARVPSLALDIDMGPELGIKRSSAQISEHYSPGDLPGMLVCAVVNFPPKQIGKVSSQVLVLGFTDPEGKVVLITPEKPVKPGSRLF